MTYPEIIREQLDNAIAAALKDGHFAASSTRKGKVTWEDIIKTLIFMQGGSLQKELYEAGFDISASAFVQRRSQIDSLVFADILSELYAQGSDPKTYCGYQVLAIDGTTVNMARNPKSPCFMCNASAPQGYNQFHANPLYDVLNKTYLSCVLQPQPAQNEQAALLFFLAWHNFERKTLIVADRGYASYNILATFQKTPNIDFWVRIKQRCHSATVETAEVRLPNKSKDGDIPL